MKWFLGLSVARKVAAAVAVLVGLTGVTAVVAATSSPEGQVATVDRVVDGDTIDVAFDGETHRVRLLNVDTPETVDPDEPIGCLGPEATAYLKDRLAPGTEVRLLYDQERTDQYDRLLAGVVVDGALVNADIAQAGYGVAVLFEPNDRFYTDVLTAQQQAQDSGVGLHDEAVACTLPSQIVAFTEAAEQAAEAPVAASMGVDDLDRHANELAALVVAGAMLTDILDEGHKYPATVLSSADLSRAVSDVGSANSRLQAAASTARDAHTQEVQRIEVERLAAEEAARKAAEEAARLAAEEAARVAAAEAAAAQAAADQAARRAAASTSTGSSASTSPAPSTPDSGYTGCRRYAPGGKTWTPMACP